MAKIIECVPNFSEGRDKNVIDQIVKAIASAKVTVNGNGLVVDSVVRPSGGNYLLLYLNVEHAAPQTFHIALAQGKQRTVVPYTLHSREVVQRHTFGPADVVYLLMPDRFANALPGNDRVPGLRDQQASQEPDARHGGDVRSEPAVD